MNERILIVVVLVRIVVGFGCPNHCFCYKWRGLLRTDCTSKNLFNTFAGFSHETQVLDLSYNVLTILHGNEFLDANLRLMEELNISNNRLHKIDKLSFNGLELLRNLDLSFNAIEYLTPTTFSSSLQILDVAHCQFEFFTSRMFLELVRLEMLNVSRNYIQKIKPEFVVGMKNLKYLDLSKNDLPCNEQTAVFFQALISHGIRFRNFCQTTQKMMMTPGIQTEENPQVEMFQKKYENISHTTSNKPNLLVDVRQFFMSIPSVYVLLCGIHAGILTGAIVTYLCMRKARKISSEEVTERADNDSHDQVTDNDSDQLTFALIPLNTPPGTPPLPYYSTRFPGFSLPVT